ncbi:hypothetical protein F8388_008926 [Cannabis sativa]|uniref:Ubiquitin-like protease family profile domain-containing protein n=1 Tax=Cannabis sativa TaxID=3483 RepID=A0A7J6H8B2_CANSA|nr:hypothetical protein F8388_008926 [Cannabis sativa]
MNIGWKYEEELCTIAENNSSSKDNVSPINTSKGDNVFFEDFKLQNTLRNKDRDMLQYIYSNSNDTQQMIVRNNFRYLGPGKEVEITFLTMVSTLLTNDKRTKTCGKARRWYLPSNITNETLPYNNLPLYQRWKKMHYYDLYMSSLNKCHEIFIPLLFSKYYILARLLLSMKKVEVWDSLADKDSPIVYSSKIKEILQNLNSGLERNKPANFNFSSFMVVRANYVPKQPNLFDCRLMCDPFRYTTTCNKEQN